VLLVDPGPSPGDLNFRLLRTHVRVHPFFWLGSVLLGWQFFTNPMPVTGSGVGDLAIWVGCVFVSILLHEFGHVWAFRRFGNDAHIVLHGFGGLAIPNGESYYRWHRIIVSAAGPAVQLVLWGALVLLAWKDMIPITWDGKLREPTVSALLLVILWDINLFWPVLNLLPIWPLDGGQISREVCTGVNHHRGVVVSLWISLVISAGLAVHCLLGAQNPPIELIPGLGRYFRPTMFMAIWFALFAVASFQALQVENSRRRPWDDDLPWDR
jgi:Zn-dependent protease